MTRHGGSKKLLLVGLCLLMVGMAAASAGVLGMARILPLSVTQIDYYIMVEHGVIHAPSTGISFYWCQHWVIAHPLLPVTVSSFDSARSSGSLPQPIFAGHSMAEAQANADNPEWFKDWGQLRSSYFTSKDLIYQDSTYYIYKCHYYLDWTDPPPDPSSGNTTIPTSNSMWKMGSLTLTPINVILLAAGALLFLAGLAAMGILGRRPA